MDMTKTIPSSRSGYATDIVVDRRRSTDSCLLWCTETMPTEPREIAKRALSSRCLVVDLLYCPGPASVWSFSPNRRCLDSFRLNPTKNWLHLLRPYAFPFISIPVDLTIRDHSALSVSRSLIDLMMRLGRRWNRNSPKPKNELVNEKTISGTT
jgi:hypothetical protein